MAFLVISAICFLGITKNETVASFALKEYEIGQIADRTIISDRTLQPTASNPVSVEDGEKIIRKGFVITQDAFQKLEKMAESPEYIDYRAYSNSLLFLLLIIVFWFFMFSPKVLGRKVIFKELLTQIIFFLAVYSITLFGNKIQFFNQSPYALCVVIPATLFVFLITLLFGEHSGVYFSFVLFFGVLNASGYSLEASIYTLATCLCAAKIVKKINNRMNMVYASFLIALLNVVFMFILKVIYNGEIFTDAWENFGKIALSLAGNGFISGILTLGLITPIELILNTASVFRLMDLSDLNSSAMKKMQITSPGTYNHSLMVANLAETACNSIGANGLLARVAANYHDIGKIDNPLYFSENQTSAEEKNFYVDKNPSLAVSIIKSHVRKSVEKAHKLHLPQSVIDIISEHHGNSLISYFYSEALKLDPNAKTEDYSHTGNPPSTIESAVVMLADTVEAACHTLENPSVPRLEKFIQTLIEKKINENQLSNCDITFRDITTIKETFVTILTGYYHSRVKYPDQKDPDEDDKIKKVSKEKKTEETKKTNRKKNLLWKIL